MPPEDLPPQSSRPALSQPLQSGDAARRVSELNARYRHHSASAVLEHVFKWREFERVALVSSFGAESVVLLHLVSIFAPQTPVLFIDTQMLFPETLAYQRALAKSLPLQDIRTIRADPSQIAQHDPEAQLHRSDADACCHLRKVVPLERALAGFDAWITGRKRYQGAQRGTIDFFELEEQTHGAQRIKINPLAHWGRADVETYMIENRLPRHPLVAKGYPSIGCAPCTSAVAAGEEQRAGRWRGSEKVECGIHFVDGKAVRITKGDAA